MNSYSMISKGIKNGKDFDQAEFVAGESHFGRKNRYKGNEIA